MNKKIINVKTVENLKHILDNIGSGINVIDKDLTIHYVNQTYANTMKEEQEYFIGNKCYIVAAKREDMCPNCPILKCIETKKRTYFSQKVYSSDGEEVYVDLTFSPLIVEDEVYAIKNINFVTEREKLKREIQRKNKELQAINEELRQITDERNEAKENLEEQIKKRTRELQKAKRSGTKTGLGDGVTLSVQYAF